MPGLLSTVHEHKHGAAIFRQRYNLIKKFILTILEEEGPCSYNYLNYFISDKLFALFDGQISRYVDLVKIDLEEKRIIERVPNSKTHKIRIKR